MTWPVQNPHKLLGWEQQEPGWYTHPVIGGICRERDEKWYLYQLESDDQIGPFKTLKGAMVASAE